jgi:hypothetical protein
MSRKFILLLPLLLFTIPFFAQEATNDVQSNTLEEQFVQVVDKSNNYQDYKIIQKSKINQLRINILDSIKNLKSTIESTNLEIIQKKNQIDSLTSDLKNTELELANSIEKENAIDFFGIETTKSTYNALMWSIISVLILSLGLFIFKFRNSNVITKDARNKLVEVEEEFDRHRQKTLEEQQQLRRKLQDEINKNRNVK